MNPLPSIIKELPALVELPSVSRKGGDPLAAVHEPHYEAKLDLEVKKIILCITKDLKPEDLALLSDYKLVEYDDNTHKNIPITAFAWDILVLDLREKGDRYCYMKEVQPIRHRYKVIAFCHGFEVDDIDVECDNVLTSFPTRQAKKEDFEMLLMMKRITKPKWWKSLFSCVLNFVRKVKN